MKPKYTTWFVLLWLAFTEISAQSPNEVNAQIKVSILQSNATIAKGAYHSHSSDSILILQPYFEVRRALNNKPHSASFQHYSFLDVQQVNVYKRSVLGGIRNGVLLVGILGTTIGALSASDEGILSGPAAGAILGAITSVPIGLSLGGSTKAGFTKVFSYRKKNEKWTSAKYNQLSAALNNIKDPAERKFYALVGGGYSSEKLLIGVRYLANESYSLNLNGSFILASARGFGLDLRNSFGKPKRGGKPFFVLAGLSYMISDTRSFDETRHDSIYLSFSIGKDFYFTYNTGLSIDFGYDHAFNQDSSPLKSYLGPRFQFFM